MDIFDKYETKKASDAERKKIVSFAVRQNSGGTGRFAVITIEDNNNLDEVLVDERFFGLLRSYIEEWEANKDAMLPVYRKDGAWRFSFKTAPDDEIERIFNQDVQPKKEEEYVRVQSYVTRSFRKKLEDKYGKDKIADVIRHALCEYMEG